MDGILEIIDIIFTMPDMEFESAEDFGNEVIRRYKARRAAEQNAEQNDE